MIPNMPPSHRKSESRYYDRSPELTEVRIVVLNTNYALQNIQDLYTASGRGEHKLDRDYNEMVDALRQIKGILSKWNGSRELADPNNPDDGLWRSASHP